jgi:WD40 repeat protein
MKQDGRRIIMNKPASQFDPQSVDEQIAQIRQQAGSSTPGATLIDDLYNLHDEDLQIRDRVWARLNSMADVAREQQIGSSTRPAENVTNIAEYQETIIAKKERKIMEENTSSWGMTPPAPLEAPKKRRSPIQRVGGIGLIAAVALITIVSFTVFSGVLKSAPQTANNTSTVASAQNQQLQKAISSGKQVCSLNAGEKVSINGAPWSADVNWSAQGQLVVGTYSNFKAYSTKNCSPIASFQPAIQQQAVGALWSPDGSKLLVTDTEDSNSTYILDRNGKILTKLQGGLISWSSDGNKIIFTRNDSQGDSLPRPAVYSDSQLQKFRISIKAVDVNNRKVTTLTQLPEGYGAPEWSSDMKTVVVRRLKNDGNIMDLATWDTNQGKLVSHTSLPEPTLGQELSPDGSMLALDNEDKIEIYSTGTWKLLASFEDKKGPNTGASFAWSPNGKYLAEVSQSIKIYDVTAKKLATTFGQVDAQHTITDLTWSPDGAGLATSTMVLSNDQPSDLTVNVWALS